jgi:pectin methylesterase-like acyl-CoA thioesterase
VKPWVWLAGALALLGMLLGAYGSGRSDGRAIEVAKQAAVDAAVRKEQAKRAVIVDQAGAAAERRETERTANVREIYRETNTITERPVYRNVCVDADGVRLLDQAAAVANGGDPERVPAAAREGPAPTPQR